MLLENCQIQHSMKQGLPRFAAERLVTAWIRSLCPLPALAPIYGIQGAKPGLARLKLPPEPGFEQSRRQRHKYQSSHDCSQDN
jgi:hypothetical protein